MLFSLVAAACLLTSVAVAEEPTVHDAVPAPAPEQLPLNDQVEGAFSSAQPHRASSLRDALQSVLSGSKTLPSLLRRVVPSGLDFKRVLIAALISSTSIKSSATSSRTCQDSRVPALSTKPFGFCTAYSGYEACLAPIRSTFIEDLYPSESTISSVFNKIQFSDKPGSCPDLVRGTMCSKADAWASTLFDDNHSDIPHICPAMSSLIWEECADVTMTPNPFDKGGQGGKHSSRRTIRRIFGNQESFEKAFRKEEDDDNCYSGVPVDDTKPIPNLPSTADSKYVGQVCVKRLKFPVDNRFLLGGAPYPAYQNRMAIIDKTGVVSIWEMDDSKIASTKWLDISKDIVTDGSKGLLSLVFHKKFNENGRLFLSMTCKAGSSPSCVKDGDFVVDEYQVDDPIKFSTPVFSKRVLYVDGGFGNNLGGQLLFSPSVNEDNLFVVVGDGGQDPKDDLPDPSNNAQSLNSLRGKVLRIGVDGSTTYSAYQIPSDNPFAGQANARGEIYAMGFKNPWRCAFDRQQPEFLFCADVGHHQFEEVDRVIKGGNYGYRNYEGRHALDTSEDLGPRPAVLPQIEYPHPKNAGTAAVIGGYVFRPDVPSTVAGTYFFGDQFGKLFSAIAVPNSGVYRMTPAAGAWRCAKDSPTPCGSDLGFVFSFFETAIGEVFVSTSKAIYKIVDPDNCGLN